MRVDLFDFDLPPDLIALRPAAPRESARLLVVQADDACRLEDHRIADLPQFFRPGDVLVVNDTLVIPARLQGRRMRGEACAKIEATLHQREGADRWRAFARPAKKLRRGEIVRFAAANRMSRDAESPEAESLEAEVIEKGETGEVLFKFAVAGADLDKAIGRIGSMPLPPYIAGKRAADGQDAEDYQTMFARRGGAVAAPTASLHFTPALIEALGARGVRIEQVTLHVGAGTFLPVKAEDTSGHRMHSEWGEVSEASARALNEARAKGHRIFAAGTTSLRVLESAAREDGVIEPFNGETAIFITPGYRFKAVDVLLTNFHLPRSTLLMLVSAFCGLDCMQRAYAHAIAAQYRFFSYGDACLLFPATGAKSA
jgi:S-adenosylmethionine:tRNA ribosyltransferase-isomerase